MTDSPMRIVVPCSTSNLGVGFDCVGCAFELANVFTFRPAADARAPKIRFSGPEKGGLRGSSENPLFRAMHELAAITGRGVPAMDVAVEVNVPNARGLGSSSTAIVAGIVAANRLTGEPLDSDGMLALASAIEGHPDNVTPALRGGLTSSVVNGDGRVHVLRRQPHASLVFVLFSPDYEVPTRAARAALPPQIPMSDAIANMARLPLLLEALTTGEVEHLRALTEDRLHEPYRASLYRELDAIRAAAYAAGAASVTVSGAGPTMLAIARREQADAVAAAWREMAAHPALGGKVRVLGVDMTGARVEAASTAKAAG